MTLLNLQSQNLQSSPVGTLASNQAGFHIPAPLKPGLFLILAFALAEYDFHQTMKVGNGDGVQTHMISCVHKIRTKFTPRRDKGQGSACT
eukprot:6487545-Amphidinium_carterae.1